MLYTWQESELDSGDKLFSLNSEREVSNRDTILGETTPNDSNSTYTLTSPTLKPGVFLPEHYVDLNAELQKSDIVYEEKTQNLIRITEVSYSNTSLTETKDNKTYTATSPSLSREAEIEERKLNLNADDVIIFLHIQKTGGLHFKNMLIKWTLGVPGCACMRTGNECTCRTWTNVTWLAAWFMDGWTCGLHADWTELTECVDPWFKSVEPQRSHRNYHYTTYLREPVQRFISEWHHVRLGNLWPKDYLCNGRKASWSELPRCARGGVLRNISLDEFVACDHNLGFNRMTRMLANLSLVNCYNRTGLSKDFVDKTLLNSAKENLRAMEFFGLTEEQEKSQFLFEVTLGVLLAKRTWLNLYTRASEIHITEAMLSVIKLHNQLDIELYNFARGLFTQRVMEAELRVGCNASVYFQRRFGGL
ncbi:heparan-sulfate 6-O-sulfotransferase 2-like [Physella acuta]|uniref:heparan-sulfate 6-O-sulfotransferase 2-like n=1 Tax=Physella acuta TaxID=109671 RepID=UPI0027DD0A2E|nr:heparan-sulfate 6-O-sulfotransferase 2-like [Physella acuta]